MSSFFQKNTLYLILGTLISVSGLVSIILSTDPNNTQTLVFVLFFFTFFLSAAGIMTLAGYMLRYRLIKNTRVDRFATSIRQGVIIGLLAVIMLILQTQELFYWWVILPLVLFFILLEAFLQTNSNTNAR